MTRHTETELEIKKKKKKHAEKNKVVSQVLSFHYERKKNERQEEKVSLKLIANKLSLHIPHVSIWQEHTPHTRSQKLHHTHTQNLPTGTKFNFRPIGFSAFQVWDVLGSTHYVSGLCTITFSSLCSHTLHTVYTRQHAQQHDSNQSLPHRGTARRAAAGPLCRSLKEPQVKSQWKSQAYSAFPYL